MSSSTGIVIDRGVRLLRAGLCLGALGDLLLGSIFVIKPQVLPLTPAPPFYSALVGVLLVTLAAIAINAAYAPHGNRRTIRWLALGHLLVGGVAFIFAEPQGLHLTLAVVEWLLATMIYLGLKMARL